MFAASSTAGLTSLTMARSLVLICCGLLMVATVNTVEAKETEEIQSRQGIPEVPGYESHLPGWVWPISECPYVSFINGSLKECANHCTNIWDCNVFIFCDGDAPCSREHCFFYKCPTSIPEPTVKNNAYTGYSKIEDMFTGPFEKIWSDSQCPVIKSFTAGNLTDCKNLCLNTDGCTAFNAHEGAPGQTDGCVLRGCKFPIPPPMWDYPNYKGYAISKGDCHHFGGVIFEDKCLYFSENDDLKSWPDAKEACSSRQGELAIFSDNPNSALKFVEDRYTSVLRYWVGGSDRSHESDWEWDNGVAISLDRSQFPWGVDEPNHPGVENCLDILRTGNDHGYNDERCSSEHQYICEIGCSFNGTIYPPGTFILNACAQLQCDGTTGRFIDMGYDDHCSKCLAYWDPHILTYDRSKDTTCNLDDPNISSYGCGSYGYNKCGNYSLTQIGRSNDPPVAVYSTFELCGGSRGGDLTCVGTVTFKNDDNTVIIIGYDDAENKLKIQVNDIDVKSDVLSSSPSIVQDTNDKVYPVVAWTSEYTNTGRATSCVSLQGSSGLLVRYCGDSVNKANTVLVWASYEIAHELRGLCGTANDNKADDFMTRDGTQGSINDPYDFPLSWLVSGDSDGACPGGRSAGIRTQNKCEANSSLQEIYQSQCNESVNLGFSEGGIDLSRILIDDCVHDLCNVTDANKWMGSVNGALPVHAEIKQKTVGHCKHKRSHKCKTHHGTCIMKTETCDGTYIERGCHGKKCVCCAPNPCNQDDKCLKKEGKCILRKDWAICDGHVNSELCSGQDCACCYPKVTRQCKKQSTECSERNGECIKRIAWPTCDGKLKKRLCKGRDCGCCIP